METSIPTARHELGKIIWETSHSDEATISATGANIVADALLAAGYRKMEPRWADGLVNDGTYEYTISSDCDGSSVQHWRRTPGTVCIEDASPWEAYEPEAAK